VVTETYLGARKSMEDYSDMKRQGRMAPIWCCWTDPAAASSSNACRGARGAPSTRPPRSQDGSRSTRASQGAAAACVLGGGGLGWCGVVRPGGVSLAASFPCVEG
jgi:hypothetical protein